MMVNSLLNASTASSDTLVFVLNLIISLRWHQVSLSIRQDRYLPSDSYLFCIGVRSQIISGTDIHIFFLMEINLATRLHCVKDLILPWESEYRFTTFGRLEILSPPWWFRLSPWLDSCRASFQRNSIRAYFHLCATNLSLIRSLTWCLISLFIYIYIYRCEVFTLN